MYKQVEIIDNIVAIQILGCTFKTIDLTILI